MLGPDDAVNGLGGRVADRATGKRFGRRLWQTVVAFGETFLYKRDLTQIASRSALDQRHVGGQTQTIHVAASCLIVQGI